MGLLETLGLIILALIGGGVWEKRRRYKADREEHKRQTERVKQNEADSKAMFNDDANAARKWLRGDK